MRSLALHIAICDDEAQDQAYLHKIVAQWTQERRIIAQIAAYSGAEPFLFSLEDDGAVDILLLDIQMGRMDGISLAKKIRQTNERMQIVFVTGYPDFALESYEVSALYYLMKPINPEKLYQVLDQAVLRLAEKPRTILLREDGGTTAVIADEIWYAEVFSHDIALYMTRKTLHLRIPLNTLESLLGEGFFRCHRSYIVNMKHVWRITKKAVILEDARELPLSRSLYDEANRAFIQNH